MEATCYVRKHACDGRCLIERMVKAIKTVVLSAVGWTNRAEGLRRGLHMLLTCLRNTFDKEGNISG
jgi:hypothetical protein